MPGEVQPHIEVPARPRGDLGQRQRAEPPAPAFNQRLVEPGQDVRQRAPVPHQYPGHVPDQPGDRGGLYTLARHVADHHEPAALRQRYHVVEVPADVDTLAGRNVLGAEVDAGYLGQPWRQQRTLQGGRHRTAFGVDARVVDGQRGPAGHVLDHGHLLGAQPVLAAAAHGQRAERLAAGVQRDRVPLDRRGDRYHRAELQRLPELRQRGVERAHQVG